MRKHVTLAVGIAALLSVRATHAQLADDLSSSHRATAASQEPRAGSQISCRTGISWGATTRRTSS